MTALRAYVRENIGVGLALLSGPTMAVAAGLIVHLIDPSITR